MRADPRFLSKSFRFWAHAKFISEKLKYSDRTKQLRSYEPVQVAAALRARNLTADNDLLEEVIEYLNWRAFKLNTEIAPLFMNREEAAEAFEQVKKRVGSAKLHSMNKQKGEKRHPSYLAGIVGMIAESVAGPKGFVDDTQNLTILTWDGNLEEIFSRRFDGVFPSTENPKAIWEIKEYYGTTSFGSRVSGAVYETLLDGYEIKGVRSRHDKIIQHYLFVDDRVALWGDGRPYLCRMVDMLHTGHVDEIFFGREVLTDWEPRLRALIKE
jgi:hypothetical protein